MRILLMLLVLVLALPMPALAAQLFVDGSVSHDGDGTAQSPFRSIQTALSQVNAGDTVIVRDGVYLGQVSTSRTFADWVTVKAEHPYRARLSNTEVGGPALSIYTQGSAKLIFEGFVFSNAHPSHVCGARETHYLVHIQDAQDVLFRDNIVFGNNAPNTCNELFKINRSGDPFYPRNIVVDGNVFYDHASAPGSDMIDSVRGGELDIHHNIFFARNAADAQSFLTLKRQVDAAALGITPRSPRHHISANIFLNFDGHTDQAFVQLGEDGYAEVMMSDVLIENNLLIGNSSNSMAAPFQFKGVRDVVVRANTIVGNMPSGAYGFRIGTEGENLQVRNINIFNNIFSDATGSMGSRFINSYGDVDTSSIVLHKNLYWNAGQVLPSTATVTPADDSAAVVADPLLNNDHSTLVLPVWDENQQRFLSGSTRIRQEFERLVQNYAAVGENSAAIDEADALHMPAVDILGNPRLNNPDIGAFEYNAVASVDAGIRRDSTIADTANVDSFAVDSGGMDAVPADTSSTLDQGGSNTDASILESGNADTAPANTEAIGVGCACTSSGHDIHAVFAVALLLVIGLVSRRERTV